MNKSLITNFLAALLVIAGTWQQQPVVLSVGLFALSGAITNWLAVHMLFEKVPGLYGSGVIPARFEDFKAGIRQLMMEQFFTEDNIDRFLGGRGGVKPDIDLARVIDKLDLEPAFDSLVDVIKASSFGGMLGMIGGEAALEPLKEPFIGKIKLALEDMTRDEGFMAALRDELEQPGFMADVRSKVSSIIEQRLNELTPQLVKDIIQRMIKQHLGWLVVWGGLFGGLIGLLAGILSA